MNYEKKGSGISSQKQSPPPHASPEGGTRKILRRKEGEYIKDIFARMDLQQIREFVLYATDAFCKESENYHIRLKRESDPLYKRLESLYHDNEEKLDKVTNEFSQALATHDAVYMEIGMKVGARLFHQLLLTDVNL